MRYAKLWFWFAVVILASFAVLGYYGAQLYHQKPPVPEQVRVVGDTIFAAGIVALVWFIAGLKAGWSLEPKEGGSP